nr:MAG TPA: hypothetical protein [Caudoviricetes sp.]
MGPREGESRRTNLKFCKGGVVLEHGEKYE